MVINADSVSRGIGSQGTIPYVPGLWTYVAPLAKAGWPRGRESPLLLSLPPGMPYSFPGASRCLMILAAPVAFVTVRGC